MDKCKLEDHISQLIGQKMITPQECLQIKRDLEAENNTDFEATPLALCMMITLLLFGIGFWIWLISWSCFFGQNTEKDEKNTRLSGGISSRSQTKEARLTKRSNKDRSDHSIRSQLYRRFNPLAGFTHTRHPRLFRLEGQTSSPPTGSTETQVSGATASSLAKESHKAPKKYKIQWTKLFKPGRSGVSNN